MARPLYIVREEDYEWWTIAGTFTSLAAAKECGEALTHHHWEVVKLVPGKDEEIVYEPPEPPREPMDLATARWYVSCASVAAFRPEDIAP